MSDAPRHELDEAIDRVAAKMVAAPVDDFLLQRVIARLPERAASPGFISMPVQGAAAAALLLLAFVYASPSREVTRRNLVPVAERASTSDARPLEAAPVPMVALIAHPRSPSPDPRPPIPDRPDHEFSLAPVDPVPALAFESIAPAALEPEVAIDLVPIVLLELRVADESAPRDR